MHVPLHITFRGMSHSDALEAHVRRRAGKLDRHFNRMIACRVVVELAHRHHHQGKRYRVSIDMVVPRGELAVAHASSNDRNFEDAHAAVDGAFDDATRRLEEYAHRLRGY